MKTPKELKEYRHNYYMQHKEQCYQNYLEWRNEKPKEASAIQERWRNANPHYYRDYMRKREDAVEPLIFQFLDNGFGSDMDGYITYLRNKGVPEKHIRWFEVDVKKHLRKA